MFSAKVSRKLRVGFLFIGSIGSRNALPITRNVRYFNDSKNKNMLFLTLFSTNLIMPEIKFRKFVSPVQVHITQTKSQYFIFLEMIRLLKSTRHHVNINLGSKRLHSSTWEYNPEYRTGFKNIYLFIHIS